MALEKFPSCGGNYSNASGVLSSPSYPNSYPEMADCVYLISQPNGTYVNISLLTMDINCQELSTTGFLISHYIEMRDGISEESALMGRFCGKGKNVPEFMQTTQTHLWIRWERKQQDIFTIFTIGQFFILRFISNFGSGLGFRNPSKPSSLQNDSDTHLLGFQFEYESTNVSQWSYGSGACGGSFTTPNSILAFPSHQDNYPDNVNCIYTISQQTNTVILLNFLSMDIQICTHNWCDPCFFDYLEIRDGPSADSSLLERLCGSEIPAPIQSSQNHLWIRWG